MEGQSGILINGQVVPFDRVAELLPPSLRHAVAACVMAPPPVRHAEPSMLFSMDDEPARPNRRLFELGARLAAESPGAGHPLLEARQGGSPRWYEVFPGEHYHVLTTLCRILDAKTVWEFGTDSGMGTVALAEGMGPEGKMFTVDIDPWTGKQGPWLQESDFVGGRITQIVSDMKAPSLFTDYAEQIAEADLIFVDGPKDGVTEDAFLDMLARVEFRRNPIVMFDDIRLVNMLTTWRGIARPKFDFTSYGHWSGTGLVDWRTA